ncbi:DMT family transporter [Halobacteriovorax sp.]|uniref:DMT family transporter n=1 Tax=Halobacteriovorax sp. TaxID=2020862 RepID=UPI00356566C7
MDKIYFSILGICAGLAVPFQAIINAKLSSEVGHPLIAALISFGGGFLVFLLFMLFGPVKFPSIAQLSSFSPILLSGGLIGSCFVFAAIVGVPKLGSTAWISLIIAGQLLMSLVLDHYGVLGLPIKTINLYRLLGVFLLFSGTYLIIKF